MSVSAEDAWSALLDRILGDLQRRLSSKQSTHERDEEAWREITERVSGIVHWHSRSLGTTSTVEPEDVVQDILVRLQSPQLITQLIRAPNPMGYFVVLVRNMLHDAVRRSSREARTARWYPEEAWLQGVDEVEDFVPEPGLEAALASLPEQDRMLIRLRFAEGYSIAEIARLTQRRYGTVAVQLHRLLKRLRALLGEEERTTDG